MKKLFALLLVLVMVIALVPTAVAATEAEGTGIGTSEGAGTGTSEGTGTGAPAGTGTGTSEGTGTGTSEGTGTGTPAGTGTGTSEGTGTGTSEGTGTGTSEGTGTGTSEGTGTGTSEGTGTGTSEGTGTGTSEGTGTGTPATCEHEHTSWSISPDWHAVWCIDCQTEISAHEPHSYDANHTCECGYVEPNYCKHEDTTYYPMGSEGHVKECNSCMTVLGNVEPHVREGNACALCGWAGFDCEHPNAAYTYNEYSHTWHCPDCETYTWGEHTGMDDGVCDVCGYKANAEHHFVKPSHLCTDPGCGFTTYCQDDDKNCVCDWCGEEYHAECIDKDLDANYHTAVCVNCKQSLGKVFHYDEDKDGKCDACGHKMSGTTGGGTTGGKENTGLDKVPKTGDVMAPVAVLSGLMSVAAVFTRKRFF